MSDDDGDMAVPKGKSIANHFMPIKMVYVSFDVETGGELQYSTKKEYCERLKDDEGKCKMIIIRLKCN